MRLQLSAYGLLLSAVPYRVAGLPREDTKHVNSHCPGGSGFFIWDDSEWNQRLKKKGGDEVIE